MEKGLISILGSDKPICCIDIESTGIDVVNDRIIEISVLKEELDGSVNIKTRRFNPGIPIPKEATDAHGISDDDVKDCPSFYTFASGLKKFINGCHIAGFNSNNFDIPLLSMEMSRAGLSLDYSAIFFIDAGNIYKKLQPRTLSDAYLSFCGKKLENAHSAEADIKATYEVLLAQLSFESVPKNLKDLALYSNHEKPVVDLAGKFSTNASGDIIFSFGKHKNKKTSEEVKYLAWMFGDSSDFLPDTKQWAYKLHQIHTKGPNLFDR